MTEDAKDAIGYGIAALLIVLAIGSGIWITGKA